MHTPTGHARAMPSTTAAPHSATLHRIGAIAVLVSIVHGAPPPPPASPPLRPALPPGRIPSYVYWVDYEYRTSSGGYVSSSDSIIVTEAASTYVPTWYSGTSIIRSSALTAATSLDDVNRIAATQFANSNYPIWQAKWDSEGSGNGRIYLFNWRSDAVLSTYVRSPRWSSGALNDDRVWSTTFPWSNTPTASIIGDPHLTGAYGGKTDFKGRDGGVYSILSAPGVALNARFKHRTYTTPYSKLQVHGSWITDCFVTLRGFNNRSITTAFTFHAAQPHTLWRSHSWEPHVRALTDGVYTEDGTQITLRQRVLTIRHPLWRLTIESTSGYPHLGVLRSNLRIQPLFDVDADATAPHGLLGQTFDRSGCPLFGRRDDYSRHPQGQVTTQAMGEGAIEGQADDYLIIRPEDFGRPGYSPHNTTFAFSRFQGGGVALPRDIHRLGGGGCLPGPKWNVSGGPANFQPELNFQGHDLEHQPDRRKGYESSPRRCYDACLPRPKCLAFTFILSPQAHRRCWLKGKGYERSAFHSNGTISGVRGV